jgi:hypothetical protein
MKTRTDLLNHLAEKYKLQRYLEIGVKDPKQNFDKIICKYKVAVDPSEEAKTLFQADDRSSNEALFNVTSDSFFESWMRRPGDFICTTEENKRDLIFIDGLHTAEQVKKDFENALKILSPGGFIVLHDCNPEKEEHTIVPRPSARGHWNGDVYKFAVVYAGYKMTVDIDNGCMVIPATNPIWSSDNRKAVFNHTIPTTWNYFTEYRKELLNLISWEEFTNVTELR